MSFDGTGVSLGTLAHELGHSMHSYLTWKSQPQVYTHYSMFVAEVASNFHQALLRAHLLETVDDPALQLAVLEEAMANFHRYFFIMPTLARFEREMHERVGAGRRADGRALVRPDGRSLRRGLTARTSSSIGSASGITWAQFAHLYEPFYVFQYATGISGAHALARGVLDGAPGAPERYLEFLRPGSSVYPLDALGGPASTWRRRSRSSRRSRCWRRSSIGSSRFSSVEIELVPDPGPDDPAARAAAEAVSRGGPASDGGRRRRRRLAPRGGARGRRSESVARTVIERDPRQPDGQPTRRRRA